MIFETAHLRFNLCESLFTLQRYGEFLILASFFQKNTIFLTLFYLSKHFFTINQSLTFYAYLIIYKNSITIV